MACGASLETRTVKITVAASKIAEKVWKCTRTIDKLQRYRTYVCAGLVERNEKLRTRNVETRCRQSRLKKCQVAYFDEVSVN